MLCVTPRCLPSDQLNSPHLILLQHKGGSQFSLYTQNLWNRIKLGLECCFLFCKKTKQNNTWEKPMNATVHMRRYLRFILSFPPPLSDWCSLLCGSVQMTPVPTWAGGRPALFLWPTCHLWWNPPDLSPSLRGRSSWKLPAWPSWTAPTLTSVQVSAFGKGFLFFFF